MNKQPMFAYPVIAYKDGGSKECYGIGYKVNVYVQGDADDPHRIARVCIGLWSLPFDKKKAVD